MGHVKGVATSPNDLLDKIRIFLIAEGFTINKWEPVGTAYRLHAQRNSTYVNFRTFINSAAGFGFSNGFSGTGIAFYVGSGYDGAQDFCHQPGYVYFENYYGSGPFGPLLSGLPAGPYVSHQFFHDGNGNVLLMVEQAPNIWRHLVWGETIDKTGAGSWTGGAYFGGIVPGCYANLSLSGNADVVDCVPMMTNPQGQGTVSFIRADVDTYVGKYLFSFDSEESSPDPAGLTKRFTVGYAHSAVDINNGSSWASNWGSIPKFSSNLRKSLFNTQDSRAILLPIMFFVHRDAGGASFLGTLPNIYLTGAKWRGMDYGQDLIIGSDTYRLFNGFVVKVV